MHVWWAAALRAGPLAHPSWAGLGLLPLRPLLCAGSRAYLGPLMPRPTLGLLALLGRLCLRAWIGLCHAHPGRTASRGPCSPLGHVSAGPVWPSAPFPFLKYFSK